MLHETADYRIRAVTQLLENLAMREEIYSDSVVLHDFARILAIPLRDGCDLMDVIGRRLRAQMISKMDEIGGGHFLGLIAWLCEVSQLSVGALF